VTAVSRKAFGQALGMLGKRGTMALVGLPPGTFELDIFDTVLTRKTILWFHEHYRARDSDREDFRYAPLICPDLSRLPPALVIVGEFDPLRDDGIAYAKRLRDEGNDVVLSDYPGMVHPFFSMGGAVDAGRAAMEEATAALRRVFAK